MSTEKSIRLGVLVPSLQTPTARSCRCHRLEWTSSGWLGLEADDRLCKRIQEATEIKATTSVIGLCNILQQVTKDGDSKARFGLVTPYLSEVQEKVAETFGKAGYEVVAESHLNRKVNVEFCRHHGGGAG
ncbi:hypothetical protein AC579_3043 [Pseudocercospora musae]|uniref:Uncharacterized protein n=1 Tax=Pseudocercospora musae TaxID=113226 RepID=A0A139IK35_9PEZI|nr:hypothetical protein AC579_3043 [Pseudocercospora musae]